jgi:NAD(P)-dependent dehydrogenase (short-subunit alcohol dehydrogenase family)
MTSSATRPPTVPGWTDEQVPDQSGRTALVTGANSGLGLATSLALARKGARVLMACRDPQRGETALARVHREVPSARAELVRLDLASLTSVREAAVQVGARTPVLDLLVDNAGVMAIDRQVTEDGFEKQLGTNHLGHFALTGLLLPTLLAARAPRVVVVSSTAHRQGRVDLDDLMGERRYGRWSAYGQSKLANLLFARELSRRAGEKGLPLLVASAHPGYAATNLQTGQGNLLLEAFMKVGNVLVGQPERNGAWPQLYAATMPDVQPDDYYGPGSLGELRGSPKLAKRTAAAQDDLTAHLLWERSEQLTGVHYDALDG